MPFWQGIILLGLIGAVLLAILGVAPFWGSGPTYQLVFFYLLAFGGTSLGCMTARSGQGPLGWITGFLVGQVYTIYTWLLWPVLLRSTTRQLLGHGSWAKTRSMSRSRMLPASMRPSRRSPKSSTSSRTRASSRSSAARYPRAC